MRALLLAALLCACDPGPDGPAQQPPDAPAVDAPKPVNDAPYMCMPFAPRAPAAACLALDPTSLRGATPFGDLDVALDYFGAGDCLTITGATIGWTGSCGEELHLSFRYPVTVGTDGRRQVTRSFDTDARFQFKPPGMAPRDDVTTIHVDVVLWHEGQDMHDIDITVSITDPLYAVAPWRVHGTFCDWPFYVC